MFVSMWRTRLRASWQYPRKGGDLSLKWALAANPLFAQPLIGIAPGAVTHCRDVHEGRIGQTGTVQPPGLIAKNGVNPYRPPAIVDERPPQANCLILHIVDRRSKVAAPQIILPSRSESLHRPIH